jgi:DNA-binding beta-propeller fold protein YncE
MKAPPLAALAALALFLALPAGLAPAPGLLPPPSGLGFDPSQDGIPQLFGRLCEDPAYIAEQYAEPYRRDTGYSLATAPDGASVYATGDSYPASDASASDYVTLAYGAATGSVRWQAREDGAGHGEDHPYSVAVAPDGARVFVTGWSMGDGTGYDYATYAYDAASGARLWQARYDGPGSGHDFAWTVRPSPDGARVFVTGFSFAQDTAWDYATLAYDAATGAQLWLARHDGPAHALDWPYLLAVSPDGQSVLVEGWDITTGGGQDWATVAYDAATGAERWVARDGTGGQDVATDVAFAPDGRTAYVTGWSAAQGGWDGVTIGYDAADGHRLWRSAYDGPGHGPELPLAVRVSPDGQRVAVMMSSLGQRTDFDYAVVSYEAATGAQRWVGRYDGPASKLDFAMSMEQSPDGATLFVTGCSARPVGDPPLATFDQDYATLALDAASGAQRWLARYDGPGHAGDAAWSLGVAPDGQRVFATGWSTGAETGYDIATLAYDAAGGAPLWAMRTDLP